MISLLGKESNLNDLGIWLLLLLAVVSVVSAESFDYSYMIEEAGCDMQPVPIQFCFEWPIVLGAVFGFFVLACYLAKTRRFVKFKFNRRSAFILMFLTYGQWYRTWGGFYKFFPFINMLVLYRCAIEYCIMQSQNGYSQSKYIVRQRNKKKARDKKNRALREKEARIAEKKEIQRVKNANKPLDSQGGLKRSSRPSFGVPNKATVFLQVSRTKFNKFMQDHNLGMPLWATYILQVSGTKFNKFVQDYNLVKPSWATVILGFGRTKIEEVKQDYSFALPSFNWRKIFTPWTWSFRSGLRKTCYPWHFSTEFTDMFKEHWLEFKEILREFNIALADWDFTDIISKYWTMVKESEIFTELTNLFRMTISLGFMKKIDWIYKGTSLVVLEPLRQQVSFVQLLEKTGGFLKLFVGKLYSAVELGSLEAFFTTEAKNAYDDRYTFIISQKVHVDLGRKAEVDDQLYDRYVHECIETTLSFLNTCKQSERSYYSQRLANLRNIQSSRILSKKEGIRIKPFALNIFGDSGVGKTAIANAVTRFALQSNGFDSNPRAVVSLNTEDKFQSEFSGYHEGVIFDDLCNTALDRTDGSPTTPIIMFLNNNSMAALNANAEMKGKVMIEPKVVTVTTNVKDLMCNQLSNEPLSIVRRFEATITQRVKPEYCKLGTNMLDPSKITHMAKDYFPDYALFTVETPKYWDDTTGDKFKSGKARSIAYFPIHFEGKPMVDVDIRTLLRWIKESSAEHFAQQKAFVETQQGMTEMKLCECGMPKEMCDCALESQAGIPSMVEVVAYLTALEIRCITWLNNFLQALIVSQYGSTIIAYLMRDKLSGIVKKSIGYYIVCVIMTLGYDAVMHVRGSWMVLFLTCLYASYVLIRFRMVRRNVIRKFANVPLPSQYFMSLSWKTKMRFAYFLFTIGFWGVLVKLAKKWRELPSAQASKPVPILVNEKPWQTEIEHWDTHNRERLYLYGDAGITRKSRTISPEDLAQLVGKKLMIIQKPNGKFCNVVPLKSNVLLLPNHMVTRNTEFVTLRKIGGHTFEDMPLDKSTAVHIPKSDFAVWYCPGAGLHKDLVDYYPLDIHEGKKVECFAMFNNDGELVKYPKMMATRERVITTEGGNFQGLKYSFPGETEGGMCMSTLIAEAKGMPFILGHHLAGRGTTGAAGILTRKQIYEAIEKLENLPGTLVSHSAAPLVTNSMGIEYGPMKAPHEKCPTNDLGPTAKINILGSHSVKSRSSPSSRVVSSVISDAVIDIMEIEPKHEKPKDMGSRRHKDVDLAEKTNTATKFKTKFLHQAVVDYETQLEALSDSEFAQIGIISDDVNLAGFDGALGFNAINFSTSIGFPGSGPKTQFVEKSNRIIPGIACPRDMDPSIFAEIAEIEKRLLKGEAIHTVFKASLKDEPQKMTKDKVRVFAAGSLPFTFCVRKYFLSLAALFQRNKIITECAVGTVVQSPDWTELWDHIGRFGWERAIAGDYAKFDARMSPQFMLAAFKILINLAEKSGNYSDDDLIIMRGLATEVCYPTYDYFGTLVQFMGSNPSGHPLTVIINSIVNSLYLRYVYYDIACEKRWWRIPLFGGTVSLIIYGDDMICTVKKGFEDFNHTAIAEKFAEVGIKYTMADKDAKSIPYVNLGDASFLKHYAVEDKELGVFRSPVEPDSIAKMLHTHLRSKVLTMKQSSGEAIQNVALKYFESGREVYTERKSQLEEVARVSGIQGYVGPLMTYDERIQWYREKFDLESDPTA